jgi:hypothetical protein
MKFSRDFHALARPALVTALSPGSYTVQVSGVNDATGEALVEIYKVP